MIPWSIVKIGGVDVWEQILTEKANS